MKELENPYASPSANLQPSAPSMGEKPFVLAGQGERFANLFIDYLAQIGIGFVLGVVVVAIGGEEGAEILDKTPNLVIGIPIMLAYYIILESTTSRTLGKLLTGTKVVREDGTRPTFLQIVGRSLCRMIPFEAFSFLGTPPRGWHDSISGTTVIKTR